jgi:septal ring factor EnvC (AmiA/AmiB activator)
LPTSKQDIRKIEEKLKELEKKIDTLKGDKKRKKEQLTSQRSHSKIKEAHIVALADKKSTLSTFGKKKAGSVTKILKKTQSDKYLLRPPRPHKEA